MTLAHAHKIPTENVQYERERASERDRERVIERNNKERVRENDLSPLCLLQTFLAPIHNRKHAKESEKEREGEIVSPTGIEWDGGHGGEDLRIFRLETHLYSPSGRPW